MGMATPFDLRSDFVNIEHIKNDLLRTLDGIDKEKLSLYDLKVYAEIVKTVSEVQEKGYMEKVIETMSSVSNGFNGPKLPAISDLK